MKKFFSGQLIPGEHHGKQRDKKGTYNEVADKLVRYLDLQMEKFKQDHLGISWSILRNEAIKFAGDLGLDEGLFKASPGWLSNALKRANKVGFSCHGEGKEISDKEADALITTWLPECFRELEIGEAPPIAYNNQSNAWFTQKITAWWILNVFWPWHVRRRGDVNCCTTCRHSCCPIC